MDRGRISPLFIASVVAALSFLGFIVWLIGPQTFHNTWGFIRFQPVLTIGVVIALISAVAGAIHYEKGGYPGIFNLIAIASLVISVGFSMFFSSYFTLRSYAAGNEAVQIESQDDTRIGYNQRAPYDVAQYASTKFMGDSDGDATNIVKALPAYADKNGIYTTSIKRRGFLQGYESTLMMDVPLFGSMSNNDVRKCNFSQDAKMRLDGSWPTNNLIRKIYANTPAGVKVVRDDAFAYCHNDDPYIIAPLTTITGGFFPHRAPYGVAVYNGTTNDVSIYTDLKEAQLMPGLPLYPKSVATHQRESIKTEEGYVSYLFSRGGYEDTSGDENSPNAGNNAEFSLSSITDDYESHFVTPLTSRGSSQNIIALGDVVSSEFTSGEMNTYHIMKYPEGQSREASSTISDRIISEKFDGYKAGQMSVFEVIPASEGRWVATIGRDQSIRYRAYIYPDGKINLVDSDGKEEASAADVEGQEGGEGTVIDTGVDVTNMSTEEITNLVNDALRELAARAEEK